MSEAKLKVRDLMIPLEEYATVSENDNLYDAVIALERAQETVSRTKSKQLHRAILVLDENRKVVGKISQMDVLNVLEPKYKEMGERISLAGFSPEFLRSMLEKNQLWTSPLLDICSKAARLKVKDFMYSITEGEYVKEDASLEEAIHMLIMGHHHSLLVTRNDNIVGIIRLTDVFAEIAELVKRCEI